MAGRDIFADADAESTEVPVTATVPGVTTPDWSLVEPVGVSAITDDRESTPRTESANRSTLLGDGIALGDALYSTEMQNSGDEEVAEDLRKRANETAMVLGPHADHSDVRRALESHVPPDTLGKAMTRAFGTGLVAEPIEPPSETDREDHARQVEREFRSQVAPVALYESMKGKESPVDTGPDKHPWLTRGLADASDAVKIVATMGAAAPYIYYDAHPIDAIKDYATIFSDPSVKTAMEMLKTVDNPVSYVTMAGEELTGSEVPEPLKYIPGLDTKGTRDLIHTVGGTLGSKGSDAAHGIESAIAGTYGGSADDAGVLFWDDASDRPEFDDVANNWYQNGGDESELQDSLSALPLRALPARLRGSSINVTGLQKVAAETDDPDMQAIRDVAGKDEAFVHNTIEQMPIGVLAKYQSDLMPNASEVRGAVVHRNDAKEWGGGEGKEALMDLMASGFAHSDNDGENLIWVPSKFQDLMRIAGGIWAGAMEADVNPLQVAGIDLFDDKPTDQSWTSKAQALRIPTVQGAESMVDSGAFNDWLEAAGYKGGDGYQALYDPDSTWWSRTLTDTALPEFAMRGYSDVLARAGGDPHSALGRTLGTADVVLPLLIPVEEMALAPAMATVKGGARGLATRRALRELGIKGSDARSIISESVFAADGVDAGGNAIKDQAVRAIRNGKLDPDALSRRAKDQIVQLARDAGVADADVAVERMFDQLRDRRARIIDANAVLQTKGGPATEALRKSNAYQDTRRQLESLAFARNPVPGSNPWSINSGGPKANRLTPSDVDVMLRLNEAQAFNAWDAGEIATPEEWFERQMWMRGDPTVALPAGSMPSETRNPAFDSWFGKSKVVDKSGKPLVVYHGTGGNHEQLNGFAGTTYFTDSMDEASAYAQMTPEQAAIDRTVMARRRLTKLTKPVGEVPSYIDPVDADVSVATSTDFSGPPGTYFTVDDGVWLSRDNGNPRLVEGIHADPDGNIHPGASEQEGEWVQEQLDADAAHPATGPNVVPVYLRMENPYISNDWNYGNQFSHRWDAETQAKALAEIERLKGLGYDGVIAPTDTVPYGPDGFMSRLESTVYVPFAPEQVKSSIANRGTFDPKDPNILHSVEGGKVAGSIQRVAPTFYSGLRRAVENLKGERFTADQLRATLRNTPGVKADEIEWTGLDRFLAGHPKPTKAEVLEWLDGNQVIIEEKTLGGPRNQEAAHAYEEASRIAKEAEGAFTNHEVADLIDGVIKPSDLGDRAGAAEQMLALSKKAEDARAASFAEADADAKLETQYGNYQLPGGSNYREVLFKLPSKALSDSDVARMDALTRIPSHELTEAQKSELASLRERRKAERDDIGNVYRAPHFGSEGENLLAHTRLSDRVGPNGEKILHVEEVQSDRGQAGRDKGFMPSEAKIAEAYEADRKARGLSDEFAWSNLKRDQKAAQTRRLGFTGEVPEMPFAKTWHELVMKRVMRMAAEGGYDGVSWTTGVQQVKRYEDATRQAVDEIRFTRHAGAADEVARIQADIARLKEEQHSLVANIREHARTAPDDDPAVEAYRVEYDRVSDEINDANGALQDARRKPSGVEVHGFKNGREVYGEVMAPEKLPDVLGKEIARKIIEHPEATGSLTGPDLTVGGEGMKGFYDRMLPQWLEKYGKKWGARVTDTEIGTRGIDSTATVDDIQQEIVRRRNIGDTVGAERLADDLENVVNGDLDLADVDLNSYSQVHYLQISKDMRRSLIEEGQPLFSRTGSTLHGAISPDTSFVSSLPSWAIRLYSTGDINTAFHESGHLMALMRPGFEANAARIFDSANGRLTVKGHEQLAEAAQRILRGTFRPGSKVDNIAADVLDTLGDVWSRIRGLPTPVPPEFRRLWDDTFRPQDRTLPTAIALVDERMPRPLPPPAFVDKSVSLEQAVKKAGQSRWANSVERDAGQIRHSLGLSAGQAAMDPTEFLSNALAYIGTERMRKSWGFGELVTLPGGRAAVPKARHDRILAETAASNLAILGKPPEAIGNDLRFDANQQRGLRRMIAAVEDSPIGQTLPASLSNPDLSVVPAEDYNTLIERQNEMRAGWGAWREKRAERAGVSGGLRLANAVGDAIDSTAAESTMRRMKSAFQASTAADDYLQPFQREAVNAGLRVIADSANEMRNTISRIAAEKRAGLPWYQRFGIGGKQFDSVDLIRDAAKGIAPEVVPVASLDLLTSLDKVGHDTAIVDVPVSDISLLFDQTPLDPIATAQMVDEQAALTMVDGIQGRMQRGMSFPDAMTDAGVTESQLNDAMGIVTNGLDRRRMAVESAGSDVLMAFAGSKDRAILDGFTDTNARNRYIRSAYDSWYSGRWDEILDQTAEAGHATAGSKYDQGSAALSALLRLNARRAMQDFAVSLVHSDIADDVASLSTGGANYNRPYSIGGFRDGREAYIDRVADLISAESGWKTTGTMTDTPAGFVSKPAPAMSSEFAFDPIAYGEARRVMNRYGFKPGKGTAWSRIDVPGGGQILVADIFKSAIEDTINTAAPPEMAFREAHSLDPRLGDIVPGASQVNPPPLHTKAINAGIHALSRMWDYSVGMYKTGLLTGIGPLIRPAFFVGNAFGGALQLFQRVGAFDSATVIGRSIMPTAEGRTVRSVIARMHGDGVGIANEAGSGFWTRDGRWLTDQAVSTDATRYGLNSSQAKFELTGSLIEDIKRNEPTFWNGINRDPTVATGVGATLGGSVGGPAGAVLGGYTGASLTQWWSKLLQEGSTSIDNYYRVGTYVDGLKQGMSAEEAASRARSAAFDYNGLTEWEKKTARRMVMFYAFQRNNQNLFWRTMLTNPSRIVGQLRLAQGLQERNLGPDSQLYMSEWMDGRLLASFRDPLLNGHYANSQRGAVTILPAMPAGDAVKPWLDIFGIASDGLGGDLDVESIFDLLNRTNPQNPIVAGLAVGGIVGAGIDPRTGRKPRTVIPNLAIELDDALTGGMVFRDIFHTKITKPWDESELAKAGADVYEIDPTDKGALTAWWLFNNTIGFGPMLNNAVQIDKMTEGGAHDPRYGLDQSEEVGNFAGIKTEPVSRRMDILSRSQRKREGELEKKTREAGEGSITSDR